MHRLLARFPLKKMFSTFVAALLSAAFVQTSAATILMTDGFNYGDGDLLTVSGGIWTKVSGTSALNVSSGKAIVTNAASDDDTRSFESIGSGVLYYGLTATVTAVPGTSGSYIATLWDGDAGADTDYFGRLQIAQGSSASTVKFGIINDSNNMPVYFTGAEFDLNTTVQIVVKFDFTTMTSTLWINPTDESSPSVTDTVAAVFGVTSSTSTLGNMVLRQASGIGTTAIDYVTVATSFGEVVAVPEPTVTILLLASGGLWAAGVMLRRRVKV